MVTARKWVSGRDLDAPGIRLFCLPHAGSGAAGFYRWKAMLPSSIAVCPVMLPGREARLGEPSLTSVSAIVEGLHAELRADLQHPYAIFGHSMSALIAYEWTRKIASDGLPAPRVLFASGRNAPQTPPGHSALHRMNDEPMMRELAQRYGGDAELVLEDADLREIFVPIIRADLTVVGTYTSSAADALACPVRAYAGVQDHSVTEEGLHGWSQVTRSTFAARRLPGDHFYHFGAGQAELLRLIAQEIEAAG